MSTVTTPKAGLFRFTVCIHPATDRGHCVVTAVMDGQFDDHRSLLVPDRKTAGQLAEFMLDRDAEGMGLEELHQAADRYADDLADTWRDRRSGVAGLLRILWRRVSA